ncbi:MAG: AbrB/MazE/SpoVT family DNA-binding domain-containing protein, partial [Gammaproteobacteria bacterium]
MQTTITKRGQTVVPAPIRKRYHIEEGDSLVWIDDGETIRVVPVARRAVAMDTARGGIVGVVDGLEEGAAATRDDVGVGGGDIDRRGQRRRLAQGQEQGEAREGASPLALQLPPHPPRQAGEIVMVTSEALALLSRRTMRHVLATPILRIDPSPLER